MPGRTVSASAIHSGAAATTSAASEDVIIRSDRKVEYMPPHSRHSPTIADVLRSRREMVSRVPRRRANPRSRTPAISSRKEAKSAGVSPSPESIPTLMPRYVEPHTT